MLKSVKGFSAIEMAIVLGVSAMVMGGGLAASKPIIEKMHKQKTERQMEKINDQLASFVHRNNRLPCPASPNPSGGETLGSEIGGGGSGAGSCTGADAVGIVPFRALGLKEKDVRDAWGDLITYHVSPAFAVNKDDVDAVDHDQVHEFCRSEDWVTDPFNTESGPETPDDPSYWTLRNSFDCIYGTTAELTSPDGHIKISAEDGKKLNVHGMSVGLKGGAGGDAIGAGEKLIVEFGHPVESFQIKLTELEDESPTNLTFQFWGSPDAGEDEYVEVSVDLTEEWIAEHVQSPHGSYKGYTYFAFNPPSVDGLPSYKVPFEVPGVDKIYKMRILTSDTPANRMSYDIYGVADVKYADVTGGSNPVNINPAKARFCCPMFNTAGYEISTDLKIVDDNGAPVVSQTRSDEVTEYADKDVKKEGSVASDIFVPAFVLVSHGPNQHGALLNGGGRVTVSATVGQGFGTSEVENSDGDNTYVYKMPDMTSDATYFDDIVMWRTQDQIYGEFGNQTCQTP